MDEKKRQSLRSVRCFRWNFLVSNVALGIIALILTQLVLPSLAFTVLKRPSFDPGQRSEDDNDEEDDEESESKSLRGVMMEDSDVTDDERRANNDDDGDPKMQNVDLDLLRRHLIQSLGLPHVTQTVPQITIGREEMARAVAEYRRRVREHERRRRREISPATEKRSNRKNAMKIHEEDVYTYFTRGVSSISADFHATKLNFQLGNLTRVLRIGNRTMTGRIASAMLYFNWPTVNACPTIYLYNQQSQQANLSLVKQLPNRTDRKNVVIDVSDQVRRWIRSIFTNQQPNYFLLSCDKLNNTDVKFTERTEAKLTVAEAKLTVRLRGVTNGGRRFTREADTDFAHIFPFKSETANCGNKEHNCCLKKVTITMKDLKIDDWIVEPKKFEFSYCKGRCRNATKQDNLHAIIQNYMHQHGKNKNKLPRLCCTASKLSSMKVLHFSKNGTEMKISTWNNIHVDKCDCE